MPAGSQGGHPAVSVVLPVYNRLRFLEPAVQSVMNQTFQDWELLIADDGSDPDTQRYLRSLACARVKICWLAHSGNPSRVRNAAIKAASGRYVAFLDSDDVWVPEKLAQQVAALRCQGVARWCYSACDAIDEDGAVVPKQNARLIVRPQGYIFEPLLTLQIGIAMPTVIAERSLLEEIGGFDEQQRFGEFHDLCLRLALRAPVLALDEPLSRIRRHQEHYSGDRIGDHAGWVRLYEKMSHLAPDRRLIRHCATMRALTSLKLARQYVVSKDLRSAAATLLASAKFSWHVPQWWWGMLKGGVQWGAARGRVSQ